MVKKLAVLAVAVFLLCNLYGCWYLVAGAAGGTGTAVWLSGKLTQQVNASYDRTINAAKSALRSLNLEIFKSTREDTVAQVRSKYTDGREVWIDIHKITEKSTKIEVRVGAMGSDKAAATEIMKRINSYL